MERIPKFEGYLFYKICNYQKHIFVKHEDAKRVCTLINRVNRLLIERINSKNYFWNKKTLDSNVYVERIWCVYNDRDKTFMPINYSESFTIDVVIHDAANIQDSDLLSMFDLFIHKEK